MRLKLKQPNPGAKNFILPAIKNKKTRYSPRHGQVNRSLPKIMPLHFDQRIYVTKQKIKTQPINHSEIQKQNMSPPLLEQQFNLSNDNEEGNITSNFKREVEKNLIMIKRQKEYNRKAINHSRYNTPRQNFMQEPSLEKQINNRGQKCFTEEDDVFKKLNSIIAKSQTKPFNDLEQAQAFSYSSYLNENSITIESKPNSNSNLHNKKANRNGTESKRQGVKDGSKGGQIKHEGNYQEWRRLSIESDGLKKINYKISSFENEASRLQKIRSKNELSLKKYIEGKSYLQKLAKYRESGDLLQKLSREQFGR